MLIKKLVTQKWTKIILLLTLAIIIAVSSSTTTYLFMHKDQQVKPPQLTTFSKAVDALKQEAHKAILVSQYSATDNAIDNVGDNLIKILTSKDANLLTNNTFNTNAFTVTISAYPLNGGKSIRRIEYVLKNNDNSNPIEESRFILQYIGATTFFSDIEYLDPNQKEFNVYENTDGCFAFALFSEPDYATYNTRHEHTNYYTDIYIPKDNKFSVEQHIDIPLDVNADDNLKLLEQDNFFKGVIYNYNNEQPDGKPECFFNSAKLSFEMPKGNLQSNTVSYNLPGLLLGLSDSQGNLRTLFIHQVDNKIICTDYTGQIIFPRNNKIFALKDYNLNKEMKDDAGGSNEEYLAGSLDFQKILCAPLGVNQNSDFDKILSPLPEYTFYSLTDIPLYVGSDYVCYIQKKYYSGGGTHYWGATDIRLDKLDNLSNFTAKYAYDENMDFTLSPNFKETTLFDLIYGSKAKVLYQSNILTYGGTLAPYMDFKQLSIKRNLGKWSLMLPIMDDYYHPGNGSSDKSIDDFAVFSNNVPAFLASNNVSMTLDGAWSNWSAKDLIKFPNCNAFLAQFDYYIGIGLQGNDFSGQGSYDLTIPINLDEYIVSINFSDANTIKSWTNELNQIQS